MLIGTKLQAPPLKAGILPRKHLVDRLSANQNCRLISVSAPAGSGKTSLICEWITQQNLAVAWYSVDQTDNDPDLFFRYLLTALGRTDSRLATDIAPFLEGLKPLSGQEVVPYLIEHLCSLHEDLYLVLDDYHFITCPEIDKTISRLLDYIPPKMHVVIISRHAISLSSPRLKLGNQMIEISSRDMKLSHRETERFFFETLGIRLSAGQVQEVTRHMEGWIGGLQLFGLSLKGQKTVSNLGNALREAYKEATDYLVDEVVDTQSDKVKTFLNSTALLDRFTADTCREVTGLPNASEILDYVLRNNLFLIPLDHEGTWYRYHHLFSGAVKKKLHASDADVCKGVYRTAALWFARKGYLEDAFRHAFASQDLEFAADILEDYLKVLYDNDQIASFRRWLLKLPIELLAQRPLLRLLECQFKMESAQLSDAAAILSDIESHQAEVLARYRGPKRKMCVDLLLIFRNLLPYWHNPELADIEKLQEVIGQISPDSRNLCGIVNEIVPLSYFYQGRLSLADKALKEASVTVFSSGRQLDRMIWFRMAATVERFQGDLSRSETTLKKGYLFLDRNGLSGGHLKSMLDLPQAWIYYLRNDLTKAMEHVSIALRHIEQTMFVYELAYGTHLLSSIHSAKGETQEAERSMRRMEQVAETIGTPDVIALTDAQVARLSVARGELQRAEKWMNRRKLTLNEPFSFRFAIECLAWMELLCVHEDYRDALRMADVLRGRCMNQNMMEAVLEIDLLCAGSFHALHDHKQARAIMEGAIRFGEAGDYIRPFVDHARMISPVLFDMSPASLTLRRPSYLSAIKKACAIRENHIASLNGSGEKAIEQLTRREADILKLVAAGYRDKEIAERAFVSIDTVRTHTRHIFEKLGVHTRVQAIRRAEELNIL